MATKKEFTAMNTGRTDTGKVREAVDQATTRHGQQSKVSPEEAAERRENMRTQGRKGVKAKRINFALSDSNYEFVTVLAKATGTNYSNFLGSLISNYRKEHPELVAQAKAVLEFANSGIFDQEEE